MPKRIDWVTPSMVCSFVVNVKECNQDNDSPQEEENEYMIVCSGGKLSLENNYDSQPECNGSYYQGAIHNVSRFHYFEFKCGL